MNTLSVNDFRAGWIPGQDQVRGTRNGLMRMDNLQLDKFGALNLCRGRRLVNADTFATGVHSLYSRRLGDLKYRYVGIENGEVIRDNGAGNFDTAILFEGEGSGTRAAFGTGFGFVYISSGTIRRKDHGGTDITNIGVQAPPNPPDTQGNPTPEKAIPEDYDVTFNEGSNQAHGATYFTGDVDPATFRIDAYKTFTSPVDTMDFGSDNFGTDDDFYIFNVRIPDFTKLVRIQLILYFDDVDVSPTTDPDLQNYYIVQWPRDNIPVIPNNPLILADQEQIIRDGIDQWSALGAHRQNFLRVGSDNTKNWTNIKGFRVVALFSEAVTGFGFSGLRVIGGSNGPLTGTYEYKQVNVNDTGTYVALSTGSRNQDHGTEVIHSSIQVTPNHDATDAQINQLRIYRRKINSLGSDPLANFLLVKVIDGYDATPFLDKVSDDEAQQIDVKLNLSLIGVVDDAFPDDVTYMEVNHFTRTLYMSPRDIWLSDPYDPDAVDLRFTIKLSGDQGEKNLWMIKAAQTIYVGTTADIYEITGDLTEQPDGTININVRGLGIKQPPTQDTVTIYGGRLYYIAADGVRELAGSACSSFNGPLDLLWQNEQCFGISPVDKESDDISKHYVAAAKNKLWVSVLLQDSSRVIFVYDFIKQYWYMYVDDAKCLFAEEDDNLLAGYSGEELTDNRIRSIDVETGNDSDSTGIELLLRTPVFDDNTPLVRKDAFTFKLNINTGGQDVDVTIYLDESETGIDLGSINTSSEEQVSINVRQLLGVAKRFQFELSSDNLQTCRITEISLEYDARPKQTLALRLPPENFGIAGRKRFPTYPFLIDTLGEDVTFTPIVDGAPVLPASTINTSDKQVFSHLFTSDIKGFTIGGILEGAHLFEFYELINPRVYEQLPDPTKFLAIPYTNLGNDCRKRFIAFAFTIDTLGANVTFTPIVDGVAKAPSTVNFNGKRTHIHYFTVETTGVDIGGTLSGTSAFEFYGVTFEECISEKMPGPAKLLIIPQDDYGTPARKRFSSYKFRINTRGNDVTFTPRIDGNDKSPSTFSCSEPKIIEHFFTEDTYGINVGGKLSGVGPFEFYGPLKPRIIEEFPDRLKFFYIPESNFGVAAKKRVRTLPLVINTNGSDVTYTPYVDGQSYPPATFNTTTRRTVLYYFVDDVFGIDYNGTLLGTDPFEFYGMLKPEEVEILPVGKKFDQLGPIEFPKIGKIRSFRLRLVPEGSSLVILLYEEDTQLGAPIILACEPNKDQILEVKLPKGANSTTFRFTVASDSPFHRYYGRFQVNLSGMETESKWILFGADPDQKPN